MAQMLPLGAGLRTGELDQFYPRISRDVVRLLRDPSDAQDAVQETFLRAHEQRESLRDPAAALSWLYSIATHVCLDRLRARSRQAQRETGTEPEAFARSDQSTSAELRVQQSEMSDFVGELNDGYRAVLLLHDVYGLTSSEIAAALGDTPGALKIRLHRARKSLRWALDAGCSFSHDEHGTLVCEPIRSPRGHRIPSEPSVV